MIQPPGTDLRAAIRAAALDLFTASSPDGVSVAEICRVARVANGSFYNFFRSKDALLADLLGDARRRLRRRLADAQRGNTTPEADHRRDVTIIVDFARDNHALFRLALTAHARSGSRTSIVEEFVTQRARQIEREVRAGRFRADLDPQLTSYALVGMMMETIDWWVRHPDQITREALIDQLTGMRWRMTSGADPRAAPDLRDSSHPPGPGAVMRRGRGGISTPPSGTERRQPNRRSPSMGSLVILGLALVTSPLLAHAAEQTILGKRLVVKDPGPAKKQKVLVQALEKASPNTLVGDPTVSGATLTVRLAGGTPSQEIWTLPAGISASTGKPFWKGTAAAGFTYKDGKGENGAVKLVKLRKAVSGKLTLKAMASGKTGPIAVRPPDDGTRGCVALAVGGGDTYIVTFADGKVTNQGAALFQVKNPLGEASCTRPSTAELLAYVATFPAMPVRTEDLLPYAGGLGALTFASGTPFNDLEFTTFDTDYIEGETAGYDTFLPADPADVFPGGGTVKIVRAVSHPPLDRVYGGARGDRIILGLPENPNPFFRSPGDGVDDDFVVIQNFDFVNGHIQLAGTPADYALVRAGAAESAASDGWYLLYTADYALTGALDLLAFIHRCDDLQIRQGTLPPGTETIFCNASKALDLANSAQFRFVGPVTPAPPALAGIVQTGSAGHEIVSGVTTDAAGNIYLIGATDGNLDGGADPANEVFVSKHRPDGSRVWVTEVGTLNGGLLFDAVTDAQYLYAVGRTFGALPGFTNAGVWDGIILKLRLDDGVVVDTDQWGNSGIDGYGAVELDDAGHLYVAGAGSRPGASVEDGDNEFLVAKHSAATLDNVWRVLEPVLPTSTGVAEAWSGVTYVPGATPGAGRLVIGGWFANPPNGAEGFLALYGQLDTGTPTRLQTAIIGGQPQRADWILDHGADAAGNIYAVGYTTSDLAGPHLGQGDAYIVKFDPDLQNPVYRQLGTARSDQFREVLVDETGRIYAIGYTYGAFAAPNADPTGTTGDVIVVAFDAALNPVASTQFGTAGEERGYLARFGSRLYVGGMTEGSLVGPHLGAFDAFALALDRTTLAVSPP